MYLPRPSIPRGLPPSDDPRLRFERLIPLHVVLHILSVEKESASGEGSGGGGGGLVPRQPLRPRLAVVRERVTDAATRNDEIFGVEI